MKKILGQTPTRASRTMLTIALSAMLVACGGGGGPAEVNPPPRFESIMVGSTAGVRDNQTGIVWAAQLGSDGLPSGYDEPTAAELLQLTDVGAATLRPYFGFVLDNVATSQQNEAKLIKAKGDVVGASGLAWAVDFGVRREPGGLSSEATAEAPDVPDYENWYILSRRSAASEVVHGPASLEGTVTAVDGLSWKFCSEGRSKNGLVCDGSATKVSAANAQQFADAANRARFAGHTDWRVPTPQELRSLLRLEKDVSGAGSTLLPVAFAGDALGEGEIPQYWTSGRASNGTLAWMVDFSGYPDPGGIELAPVADQAYVRLVRTSR